MIKYKTNCNCNLNEFHNWNNTGVRRYYTAEGVRIYSQETWYEVTEGRGKQLVEQHIDVVVQLSVSCLFF